MKKQDMYKVLQRGSLMVEALALLGLITMVTPVMYKKAAERTTELQDINIATQMRTLNEALDNYVRNNYEKVKTLVNVGTPKIVAATDASSDIVKGVNAYLPSGFNLSQSKYFDADKLKFSIKREDDTDMSGKVRSVYTTAVLAPSLNPIKFNRASKIASMVGINGGTIKGTKFEGAQGAWSADPSTWFSVAPADLKTGSLMSISNEAIAEGTQADTSKMLYRVDDGDDTKNTMETKLLMGSNNIEQIGALFGQGGTLTIGSNDTNNLIVKGMAEITNTITAPKGEINNVVTSDLDVNGNADITGTTKTKSLTVDDSATVTNNLDIETGNVTVKTGGLAVNTGETSLKKLSAGDTDLTSLIVINNTQTGTLDVLGKATIGSGSGVMLEVKGDADVTGTLTVDTLEADNLHANEKLTVGPGGPSYLKADSSGFWAQGSTANVKLEVDTKIRGYTANEEMLLSDHTAKLVTKASGEGAEEVGFLAKSAKEGDSNEYAKMQVNENNFVNVTNNSARMQVGDGNYLNIAAGAASMTTTNGSVAIGSSGITANYGGLNRLDIGTSDSTLSSANNASKLSLTSNGFSLTHGSESFVKTDDDVLAIKSKNMIVDANGMVLGNLPVSAGDGYFDVDGMWVDEDKDANNKVVISRKGYINLVSPNNAKGAKVESGFIRARRLVSDVRYPEYLDTDENVDLFSAGTADGDAPIKYKYYEVNPAYTSVMNDIKLASRGGARLSDILPDYVIKGIYVADNTYHAGSHEHKDEDDEYTNEKVTYWGDALNWEEIEIVNGAPKDGIIDDGDTSTNRQTMCTGEGECKIYSCESTNCVASPWMGFIPLPQCPAGYQAVVTSNPIRWRMSEVYYLNDEAAAWDKDAIEADTDSSGDRKNYAMAVSDLNTYPDGRGEEGDEEGVIRFRNYFSKHTDPLSAHFKISDATATADTPHTHDVSAKPITFQTNTWLNSSVSPHIVDDKIEGWHMLMGFLYTPGDYSNLLKNLGYVGDTIDADAIYWNIFPVYAQEMASIVTTYCSFNRRDENLEDDLGGMGWKWNAGSEDSPVLNYDQLDPNYYRDPNSYDRNPTKGGDGGYNWSDTVNDPTLPYNDAW